MSTSERWKQSAGRVRIGVIADTHGQLHPDVPKVFAGVDHIIHAGDVDGAHVLEQLRAVADTTAVVGNLDPAALRTELPVEATGEVRGVRFLVGHVQRELLARHPDPAQEGFDLVVTGHTHRAYADWHDGVLYLNPGSATAPSMGEQASVAVVEVDSVGLDPRIISLG
jgi:putative phosphoesterase